MEQDDEETGSVLMVVEAYPTENDTVEAGALMMGAMSNIAVDKLMQDAIGQSVNEKEDTSTFRLPSAQKSVQLLEGQTDFIGAERPTVSTTHETAVEEHSYSAFQTEYDFFDGEEGTLSVTKDRSMDVTTSTQHTSVGPDGARTQNLEQSTQSRVSTEYEMEDLPSQAELDWTLTGSFLDFFEELPYVEEISSVLSGRLTADSSMMGTFVDPITGTKHLSTYGLQMEEEEEEEDEEECIEEVSEETEIATEDILDEETMNLLREVDAELSELDPKPMRYSETDVMDVTSRALFDFIYHKPDAAELAAQEEAKLQRERVIRNCAEDFLTDLITMVVNVCEDPKSLLRRNLSKKMLLKEIEEKLNMLEVEQRDRYFLNRKVVEYFKRKRMFRSIMEDPADRIITNMQRYQEVLCHLDRAMELEQQMKEHVAAKLKTLVDELNKCDQRVKQKVQQFEDLVKATFVRDVPVETGPVGKKLAAEILRRHSNAILNLIKKIGGLRMELAHMRLRLIKKQHTYAAFQDRMAKIQDLGEGLKLSQYENLRTEVMQLSKKCEERNTELSKVRKRCHLNLHYRAHMKEKINMLRNQIFIQRLTYGELCQERQSVRTQLYKQKVRRSKMRKEIEDLSYQGGLVDKPALMLDYDKTVDRVEKQTEVNNDLRRQYNQMLAKVRLLENRCRKNGIAIT